MIYIFLVDTGTMMTFDMNLALESVEVLKGAIHNAVKVPTDKQAQVEGCLNMPATYNAVVARTQLAQQFYEHASEVTRTCRQLVHDQHLQQQGWAAVVANLEDIVAAFRTRHDAFQQNFVEYLSGPEEKVALLQSFEEDLKLLARIPVFPELLGKTQEEEEEEEAGKKRRTSTAQKKEEEEEKEEEEKEEEEEEEEQEEEKRGGEGGKREMRQVLLLDWISAKDSQSDVRLPNSAAGDWLSFEEEEEEEEEEGGGGGGGGGGLGVALPPPPTPLQSQPLIGQPSANQERDFMALQVEEGRRELEEERKRHRLEVENKRSRFRMMTTTTATTSTSPTSLPFSSSPSEEHPPSSPASSLNRWEGLDRLREELMKEREIEIEERIASVREEERRKLDDEKQYYELFRWSNVPAIGLLQPPSLSRYENKSR